MTEGAAGGTSIGEARGPTHTGPGSQHNHFYGASEVPRPKVVSSRVAVDQRLWLQARFVPPPGFGEARHRLEKPGSTVLLAGPSGSGRRTAAVMLLHDPEDPTASFVELSFPRDSEDSMPPPEAGDRLLFDLSGTTEEDYGAAQQQLYSYWGRVELAGARLVAVLPSMDQELLLPALQQLVVGIDRPREVAVLRRHLEGKELELAPEDLQGEELRASLGRFAMRDMQRFADLVARARTAGPSGPVSDWIRQALGALSDRSGEVALKIAALASGRQRALLLAAAMLAGAPADAVFHHMDRLLGLAEHTPDDQPLLERIDLAEQLKSLPLRLDDRGRIDFDSLAYDEAVRTHFWTFLPWLKGCLGQWVAEVVDRPHPALVAQDRRRLVERFAEQSLRAADWKTLHKVAWDWAADPRSSDEALALLRLGLDHDRYGAGFRSRILEWAKGQQVSASLATVLARACGEVLARTHPDQAVVRLHHLARRTVREGPAEVRETLYMLVRRDRRLYQLLLSRIRDGLSARQPRTEDVQLFLELVGDPLGEPLLQRLVPGGALAATWAKVLAVAQAGQCAEAVRRWLSAARTASPNGEWLTDVLVAGADAAVPDHLTALYLTGREWVTASPHEERPGRAEVAARLWQKIDSVQGIEPAPTLRTDERTG
ncbi:hypothetical protein [Kitasatospora purpeofusca]|uniref:hypothetical protein n=1 Tax=Kitasatospora purpeofusca TaxID=67352 RepID=UPI00365B6317